MLGRLEDNFHLQQPCTTAAAVDKLRGQCLDLSFPASSASAARKVEHADLTMFLDAAHVGEVGRTRKNRPWAARPQRHRPDKITVLRRV